jgi:hypothetical protein
MAPHRRALPWLVLLTVVLRLALLTWSFTAHPRLLQQGSASPVAPVGGVEPGPDLHTVGYEASNIARALVCRARGFADPFGAPTGPTAWISPGVVALYAAAFALFGCFTAGAIAFVFTVGVGLSAAMTVLMAVTAQRLYDDRRVALWAGVLFALSPFDLALFTAASSLDLNLHAFFLLLLLYLLLGLRRAASPSRRTVFALTTALATLFNPVFLLTATGGLLWVLWGTGWRRVTTGLAWLAVAQALIVGPYVVYQRQALGMWVFVKSNAFFELRLGNRPDVAGIPDEATFRRHHPSQDPQELDRYRRLGEAEYLRRQRRSFVDRLSLGDFVRSTLRRIAFYSFGYAPRGFERSTGWVVLKRLVYSLVGAVLVLYPVLRRFRLRREEGLVYWMALSYAAPHLVAVVIKRYVLPVTPLVLLLAASAVVAWMPAAGRGEPRLSS